MQTSGRFIRRIVLIAAMVGAAAMVHPAGSSADTSSTSQLDPSHRYCSALVSPSSTGSSEPTLTCFTSEAAARSDATRRGTVGAATTAAVIIGVDYVNTRYGGSALVWNVSCDAVQSLDTFQTSALPP